MIFSQDQLKDIGNEIGDRPLFSSLAKAMYEQKSMSQWIRSLDKEILDYSNYSSFTPNDSGIKKNIFIDISSTLCLLKYSMDGVSDLKEEETLKAFQCFRHMLSLEETRRESNGEIDYTEIKDFSYDPDFSLIISKKIFQDQFSNF